MMNFGRAIKSPFLNYVEPSHQYLIRQSDSINQETRDKLDILTFLIRDMTNPGKEHIIQRLYRNDREVYTIFSVLIEDLSDDFKECLNVKGK